MEIRPERPDEAAAIRDLTERAFRGMRFADGDEHEIPGRLRAAGALTLSLVAVEDGALLGHAAFSPVEIDGARRGWFGLGPLSVAPGRRRGGIGGALVREGLARLEATGAAGCVVLGDPAYYGRFGFAADPELRYGDRVHPAFQRLVLRPPAPRGRVAFHPAFGAG